MNPPGIVPQPSQLEFTARLNFLTLGIKVRPTFIGLGQRLSLKGVTGPVFLPAGSEDDITAEEQPRLIESGMASTALMSHVVVSKFAWYLPLYWRVQILAGQGMVDRLRRRFSIERVCVVVDCGMISAETIAEPRCHEARG